MQQKRNRRRILEGEVVSNKMNKTVIVSVLRKFRHPKYEKLVQKKTKCYAHDPKNELQIGQKVRIMSCRPMSKLKRWRILEMMQEVKK